jgi:hypothetical protein
VTSSSSSSSSSTTSSTGSLTSDTSQVIIGSSTGDRSNSNVSIPIDGSWVSVNDTNWYIVLTFFFGIVGGVALVQFLRVLQCTHGQLIVDSLALIPLAVFIVALLRCVVLIYRAQIGKILPSLYSIHYA